MTTRKLEDYRLGDKVEVKTAADPDNWYPGTVSAIRQHLEEGKTRTTLTVKWCSGSVLIFTSDGSASVRYPNDAIPIGTEIECSKDGKTWERGVVTSQVTDHTSYWVKHPSGFRHWPTDKVRIPTQQPVRSADDLAKELEEAHKRNAHMEMEWKRIVEVNGKFIAEAKVAQDELAKVTHEAGKLRAEAARLSGVEAAIESWRERAVKAEATVAENERKQAKICRQSFRDAYDVGQARYHLEEAQKELAAVQAELAKVKEAHGDTTKAHFQASYNLGIARSERDDLAKELEREKENHLLLVKTFREVIDKLTKKTREQEEIIEAKRVEILNLCSHEKKLTARAESAEKALAERANIHGLRHEDIEQIEAMWKRKFEALEKKLCDANAGREIARADAKRAWDKLAAIGEIVR